MRITYVGTGTLQIGLQSGHGLVLVGPNCNHTHPCKREAEEGLTPTEEGEALNSQGWRDTATRQ